MTTKPITGLDLHSSSPKNGQETPYLATMTTMITMTTMTTMTTLTTMTTMTIMTNTMITIKITTTTSSPEHCPEAPSLCSRPSLLVGAPPRQQRRKSEISAFTFRINSDQVGCGVFGFVSWVALYCRLSFYLHAQFYSLCFLGALWCPLGIIPVISQTSPS